MNLPRLSGSMNPPTFGARFKLSPKIEDGIEGIGSAASGAGTVYTIGVPAGTVPTVSLLGGGSLALYGSKQLSGLVRGTKGGESPTEPAADDSETKAPAKKEASPMDELDSLLKE